MLYINTRSPLLMCKVVHRVKQTIMTFILLKS